MIIGNSAKGVSLVLALVCLVFFGFSPLGVEMVVILVILWIAGGIYVFVSGLKASDGTDVALSAGIVIGTIGGIVVYLTT